MLFTQAQLFTHEEKTLANYALKSRLSRGRKYIESEDRFRLPFQRDRDRIIHSKAFRRLSGKTQVFIASYGDHYRSRLTHSFEVAMTARDIARALGLNEELCEAIALAHDIGHTPFGHAGEQAMNVIMMKYGNTFEHNEQTLRIVQSLERRTLEYPGLNLTFETLEGLMKHNSVIHSLEAQVVDIADQIAYHHHDLDDGLRAGILTPEVLQKEVALWQQAIDHFSFSEINTEVCRRMTIGRLMNILIKDVVMTTDSHLLAYHIDHSLSQSQEIVAFSPKIQEEVDQLAEFLGKIFYLHEKVSIFSHRGQEVIQFLFEKYSKYENLLPISVRHQFKTEHRYIVIKDYIAGMTDQFALKKYRELKDI